MQDDTGSNQCPAMSIDSCCKEKNTISMFTSKKDAEFKS